jgi:hypothetical protein
MRRSTKSKIEYRSMDNPTKTVRAWNKKKASRKLKTEISRVREVKQDTAG